MVGSVKVYVTSNVLPILSIMFNVYTPPSSAAILAVSKIPEAVELYPLGAVHTVV